MIRFELRCDSGHAFEAWFKSNAAYEQQASDGSLSCPMCASSRVEKAIMAPAVASGRSAPPEAAAKVALMLQMVRALQHHVRTHFEDVGDRFATEARKIHEGTGDPRDIFGKATAEELRELLDDGVPFAVLPELPEHDA